MSNFKTDKTSSRKITRAGDVWDKLWAALELAGDGELTDKQVDNINQLHPEYRRSKKQWTMTRDNMCRIKENEILPLSVEMDRIVVYLDKNKCPTLEVATKIEIKDGLLSRMRSNQVPWDPSVARRVAKFAIEVVGYSANPATRKVLALEPVEQEDLSLSGPSLARAAESNDMEQTEEPVGQLPLGIEPVGQPVVRVSFLKVGERYLIDMAEGTVCRAVFVGHDPAINGMVFEGSEGRFAVCRNNYGIITVLPYSKPEVAGEGE